MDVDQRLVAALERLSQGRRAFVQAQATRLDASPLQLDLLDLLARRPGAPQRIGNLARELDLAPPTVTDAINTLVAKGLVADRTDAADRRRRLIELTPAGRRLAKTISQERQELVSALSDLDESDKAATLSLLLELISDLNARGVITVDHSCKTCRFHRTLPDDRHHCELIGLPLTRATFRVDCAEHQPAS